jgi:hypothetical protein
LKSSSHVGGTLYGPVLRQGHSDELILEDLVVLSEIPHHVLQLLYGEASVIGLLEVLKSKKTLVITVYRVEYFVDTLQSRSGQFDMRFGIFLFALCSVEVVSFMDGLVLNQPLLNFLDFLWPDVMVVGPQKFLKADLSFILDIKVLKQRPDLFGDELLLVEAESEVLLLDFTFVSR